MVLNNFNELIEKEYANLFVTTGVGVKKETLFHYVFQWTMHNLAEQLLRQPMKKVLKRSSLIGAMMLFLA